jgi:hypothetical protein
LPALRESPVRVCASPRRGVQMLPPRTGSAAQALLHVTDIGCRWSLESALRAQRDDERQRDLSPCAERVGAVGLATLEWPGRACAMWWRRSVWGVGRGARANWSVYSFFYIRARLLLHMGCNTLSLRSRLNVSGYAALSTPSRLCAWKHVTNVVVLLEPPALVPVRRRVAQWRSRSG